MNTVLCFVFLAFALVLSHQDVQKRGGSASRPQAQECETTECSTTRAALDNLKNAGAPISMEALEVTDPCRNIMIAGRLNVGNTGIRYDFQETCYVIGNTDLTMSVKSKTEAPVASTALSQAFQAVFLYYEDNKNTYMILDPSAVRWFFTSRLSGCDVFVARPKANVPVPGNKPIVIHSNLNKCANNVKNLRLKGDSVDKMINSHHPNYELIARVYCQPLPEEMVQANKYLRQYESRHPGIKLISYQVDPPAIPQLFYFIGDYKPEKWEFILKGADDGQLTPVANVPEA